MRRHLRISCGAFCVLAAALLLTAVEADGAGYYNLPSSGPQQLGYGVGPGYHANLLLGRAYKAPTSAKVVRRLKAPYHPLQAPPVMTDFGGMSTWRGPVSIDSAAW